MDHCICFEILKLGWIALTKVIGLYRNDVNSVVVIFFYITSQMVLLEQHILHEKFFLLFLVVGINRYYCEINHFFQCRKVSITR